MIIYNPQNKDIIENRISLAEKLLNQIPAKHCFITGSFLYKENYKDIDIFIITRTKKNIKLSNNKATIHIIDFNDLHSLFYHSISKSCIAKNILPKKPLKVTIADYWSVINEAVPTLLNQQNKFHKHIRFLILYTEFFKSKNVLDSFELDKKIKEFKNIKNILSYTEKETPKVFVQERKPSYLKRFFYTQAAFYKALRKYKAQNFLYNLTHSITKGLSHG